MFVDMLNVVYLFILRQIEKKPGVTDVRLLDKTPADKSSIYSWERVNNDASA